MMQMRRGDELRARQIRGDLLEKAHSTTDRSIFASTTTILGLSLLENGQNPEEYVLASKDGDTWEFRLKKPYNVRLSIGAGLKAWDFFTFDYTRLKIIGVIENARISTFQNPFSEFLGGYLQGDHYKIPDTRISSIDPLDPVQAMAAAAILSDPGLFVIAKMRGIV